MRSRPGVPRRPGQPDDGVFRGGVERIAGVWAKTRSRSRPHDSSSSGLPHAGHHSSQPPHHGIEVPASDPFVGRVLEAAEVELRSADPGVEVGQRGLAGGDRDPRHREGNIEHMGLGPDLSAERSERLGGDVDGEHAGPLGGK
jgi:hypothetical protein